MEEEGDAAPLARRERERVVFMIEVAAAQRWRERVRKVGCSTRDNKVERSAVEFEVKGCEQCGIECIYVVKILMCSIRDIRTESL